MSEVGGFNRGGRGGGGGFGDGFRGGRGGFAENPDSANMNTGRGGFSGGRGGFSGGRGGGFGQPSDQTNNQNEGFSGRGGRGGNFGENSGFRGGRGGGFGQGSDSTNNQNEGFSGRGGRGGNFGDNSGFRGGRGGGFGQGSDSTNNQNEGFSGRGGRGGNFGDNSGFRGGRGGGFGSDSANNQNENTGFSGRGGRGGNFGDNSGFRGGRGGGFGQGSDSTNNQNEGFSGRGGRGGNFGDNSGFRGGRGGGFGQPSDSTNTQNEGFSGRGGRGGNFGDNSGFRGGRGGGFGQGSDSANNQNENPGFSGRGGGRGGSSRFNQNNDGSFGGGRSGFNLDGNAGNNDGEQRQRDGQAPEGGNPEGTPIGYTPTPRAVDELFTEDQTAAKEYADVVDNDEDIVVENFVEEIARIQTWEEAEFQPQLLKNIKERSKYTRPRKIQSAAIPFILDGFDVKSQSETGSGKTAAFVLPIIESCLQSKESGAYKSEMATPYAIIIGPTRELVLQVFEQAEKFAADTGVSVAKAYGQYNIGKNHAEIRAGCDILCATPGRLKQFVVNGEVNVKSLKFLVLDEADRLLDSNFSADIQDIVSTQGFPPKEKRQTLMFSATYPQDVLSAAQEFLRPEAVFITNHRNNPNKRIQQTFVVTNRQEKLATLLRILKEEADKAGGSDKIRRTLVFTNVRRMSDMAALYLSNEGIPATCINGDRGQHLREKALQDFRSHKVSVLVATDVCARGIDVKQLDHVINLDMPDTAITYVHRIGRTGRIAQGFSTSFVEGGEQILHEIAQMMRDKNEDIPEGLKAVLVGNGGSSFTQGFSANKAPLKSEFGASQATTAVPASAATNADAEEDDWA